MEGSIALLFAVFVIGVAAGIALTRLVIMTMLDRFPVTLCDYCEWHNKKNRLKSDGSRHTGFKDSSCR